MRFALALPLAAALSLSAPLATEVAAVLVDGVSPTLATALDGAFTANAAIIRKGNIRKSNNGYTTNFVVVPDGPDDEVAAVEVTFLPELGAPEPGTPSYTLTAANAQGAGVFRTDEVTFASDPSSFGYTMVATMLDADGEQVGDAFATGAFAQELVPLQVASIALQLQDDGAGELSVLLVGDSLADVGAVEVGIYGGDESPAECVDGTTCSLTATSGETAVAWVDVVTFEEPDSALGVSYDIEFLVLDSENAELLSGTIAVTAEAP